jgi:uncharacterized protein YoxC
MRFSTDNFALMPPWTQTLLGLAAVALLLALCAAALAVRRALLRVDAVLAIVEQELRPLVGQAHALTGDVRELTHEAKSELERINVLTRRLDDLAGGLARFLTLAGGLARVGQVVGLAAALKRGIDVFVHRVKAGPR